MVKNKDIAVFYGEFENEKKKGQHFFIYKVQISAEDHGLVTD